MRHLGDGRSASFSAGDDHRPNGESFGPQDKEFDDKEEKTAEVNTDEELFSTNHLQVDDNTWEGLETAYNFHLQLASIPQTISCPICLRVTQTPARQECGHVLCFYCMQQSISSLGDCPLCQAQHIFKVGKGDLVAVSETEMRTMGFSYSQDLQLPITSSGILSVPVPYQSSVLVDQMHFSHSRSTPTVPTTHCSLDVGRTHHDLLPHTNDVSLQLDNLSDLDDVIDLDDLVSSDCERPSPPVAARTSLSGNFVPGRVRQSRLTLRKSALLEAATPIAPKVTRPQGQVGKRKIRSRKVKREELSVVLLEWDTVQAEGTPPEHRYDCGLTIYGSYLIVVGGIVGKLRLNDLHILDLAAEHCRRWIQPLIGGTPPGAGSLLQVFVIRDTLYVIGGTVDGKFLTELHALNLTTESGVWSWEKLEVAGTPPSMRYWYSLTVLQGMAILYGGYGHPQRLSDTFALRFDTDTPTWVELQPRGDLPGPSSTHSVSVVKDQMYLFGGYDGKYRRGQLFAFEIESVSIEEIGCVWRKVETQGHGPASRYTHSSTSIGSQLIVYGGNTGCLKGDAYVLDFGTAEEVPTWKLAKSDPPLVPRAWHRAVAYNDAMYVFGGHTADNQVMRIAIRTSTP